MRDRHTGYARLKKPQKNHTPSADDLKIVEDYYYNKGPIEALCKVLDKFLKTGVDINTVFLTRNFCPQFLKTTTRLRLIYLLCEKASLLGYLLAFAEKSQGVFVIEDLFSHVVHYSAEERIAFELLAKNMLRITEPWQLGVLLTTFCGISLRDADGFSSIDPLDERAYLPCKAMHEKNKTGRFSTWEEYEKARFYKAMATTGPSSFEAGPRKEVLVICKLCRKAVRQAYQARQIFTAFGEFNNARLIASFYHGLPRY